MLRKPTLPLLALLFASVSVCITIATGITPTRVQDVGRASTSRAMDTSTPAEAVEAFLRRAGQLPPPGTNVVLQDGALAWEAIPEESVEITRLTVERVRLTAGEPLLAALLDDDPTCSAEVEVVATTGDGERIPLIVSLWDYGLITPWSVHLVGDGWKPQGVRWPPR